MTAMTPHDIEATLRKLRLSGMAETLQRVSRDKARNST